jgi:hypothetical protein
MAPFFAAPNSNIHPRFWGWMMGTGTPLSMIAEMLGAAIII